MLRRERWSLLLEFGLTKLGSDDSKGSTPRAPFAAAFMAIQAREKKFMNFEANPTNAKIIWCELEVKQL
jgi:hypothetical protein